MSVFMPESTRARDVWRAILGKPFSVEFRTPQGIDLPVQIIRVEYEAFSREELSDSGDGAMRRLSLFGIRNHPTVPDTIMEQGFRLVYENREYTVADKIIMPGEIQARGFAIS